MKKVLRIQQSPSMHWVGNGFPVRSVFDYTGLGRELNPFILMDYAAPYDFPPGKGKRGVGAHPHRGFETVTVVYQGELEHRDSSGGGGKIGPGDVQWMTAASGILHEEFHSPEFTAQGGTLEMAQLWVNLPAKDKDAAPGYQTLKAGDIPVVELPDDAGSLRVIAGSFAGKDGPARTFTPIQLWDLSLKEGGKVELPLEEGHVSALLVNRGEVSLPDGTPAEEGALIVLAREGKGLTLVASDNSRILVMSGQPIDEPIAAHGPFVMNTSEQIREAFKDFQEGRLGELVS